MSVVKRVNNFARCHHWDISLLVLAVLQIKIPSTASRFSFWCLCNIPVCLLPGTGPALQHDSQGTRRQAAGEWHPLKKVLITSPLKKEIQNECHTHSLHLRAVCLDAFVTYQSILTAMSFIFFSFMILASFFGGGGKKRASSCLAEEIN